MNGAEEQARALAEPFPKALVRRNPKGKDYVAIAEVVARMNAIVGAGNWRVDVRSVETYGEVETAQGDFPSQVVATVRVHVKLGDEWTWCDGLGGQAVETMNATVPMPGGRKVSKGLATDLGDTFKGAVSDATKKALQHLGVALELARKDEALAYERQSQPAEEAPVAVGESSDIEAIRVALSRLKGAQTQAYLKFRRERGLPADPGQFSEADTELVGEFLIGLGALRG